MDTFRDVSTIVMAGHTLSRAEAIKAAIDFLVQQGMNEFDAEEATMDRPNRVVRVWWDPEIGYCNPPNDDNKAAGHNPQPVTVVNASLPD